MSEKLEKSKSSGAHKLLNEMVGEWQGTTKTWFEPDKLADESPIKGTMKPLMNGRFILHEYTTSMEGKPIEGIVIYGNFLGTNRYQSAWIDSFHTGTAIMFFEGEKGADNISMMGSYSYVTPEKEHIWGWRTTIEVLNKDEVVITAYNVSPEGEEAKATETVYKRVK